MHLFRAEILLYRHEPDSSFFLTLTLYTVNAVNKAGLADELDDADATLTLFAPTNTAFSKLPCGLLDKLLLPIWKPQLVDLLLYHVLGEPVSAPYEVGTYATTNYGEETIDITNGAGLFPTINKGGKSARIDTKNECASNGVVHVINNVLTPLSVTSNVVDIAVEDPDTFSTLVIALDAAGLIGTLEGAGPFTVFGELFCLN
jgi:transforming growth factor-beta-induced protein